MARIPTTFARPQRITPALTANIYYTVPSGSLAIVRYVSIMNDSHAPQQVGVFLGAGTDAWLNFSIPADTGPFVLYPYVTLVAGDTIEADCGTNLAVTITIAGDLVVLG